MARWPYNKGPFTPYDWARGPNRENPQARGLIAWWPPLASRGAPVLRDLSTRGHHATINGATWATVALQGATLSFDGNNDFIDCGDPVALRLSRDFTLSAWVNPAAIGANRAVISHGDGEWYWRMNAAGKLQLLESQVAELVTSTTSLVAGSWYHIAATISASGTIVLYLNGSADGTDTTANVLDDGPTANAIDVGCDLFNVSDRAEFWTGLMADVRIYNRALSASEVRQLYADPWALYPEPRLWAVAAPAASGNPWYYYAQM